ncbi:capsular polysaccharide synthesis protein-domain-containing protein [Pavlovales sp. CCMP2436]|nr:capsular polysaccharide synthesis protein-domain-containing protein [Pavlovales sp. CCMP2436]|mmetsp:Transcript_15488/g.39323  ORF Transcript_15488/g.39323 Transcript_15488/m.39323 type:complete len:316 (+) Transcript_15488:47-994(+)
MAHSVRALRALCLMLLALPLVVAHAPIGDLEVARPGRTIWMFWDSGEGNVHPPGLLRKMCMDAWVRLNPSYSVRILDLASAVKLAPVFAKQLRRHAGLICIQLLADLLRMELLSKFGGVWADATLLPVHPLNTWLPAKLGPAGFWIFTAEGFRQKRVPSADCHKLRFGFNGVKCRSWLYKDHNRYVLGPNWFIAAEPRNPVVSAWFHEYHRSLNRVGAFRDGRPPYHLHSCTLTLLQQTNSTVHAALARMPSDHRELSLQTRGSLAHTRVEPAMWMYKVAHGRYTRVVRDYPAWLTNMTSTMRPRAAGLHARSSV